MELLEVVFEMVVADVMLLMEVLSSLLVDEDVDDGNKCSGNFRCGPLEPRDLASGTSSASPEDSSSAGKETSEFGGWDVVSVTLNNFSFAMSVSASPKTKIILDDRINIRKRKVVIS